MGLDGSRAVAGHVSVLYHALVPPEPEEARLKVNLVAVQAKMEA